MLTIKLGLVLMATAIAIGDTDVNITDVDDTNIESATIILTNPLNGASESLAVSGSLPTGITASSYDPGTGTITLTGSASLADYQTAINQIVYDNIEPDGGLFGGDGDRDFSDRTVTVVVNDGDNNSNTATTTISLVADNTAPTLDLNGTPIVPNGTNFTNTFTEDAGAVGIVDTDVAIADGDGDNISTATITLTNTQIDDRFVIDGTAVDLGDTGMVNGINYEVVDNGGQLEIQLTGLTTPADYQTALQLITFENTSDDPNTTDRDIEIVVSDGLESSPIRTSTISVIPVNDPPEIDLDSSNDADNNYTTTFVEDAGAISISDVDPLIIDSDDTNIESATITLTNAQAGDLLTLGTLTGGITASIDDSVAGQITVTLSNSATLEEYQQAISAISFNNIADTSNITPRQINVVVNDGDANSNTATTTINITTVNDPPIIDLNGNDTGTNYSDSFIGNPVAITDTDAIGSDADGIDIESLTIDISGATDTTNELLIFNDASGNSSINLGSNSSTTVTIQGTNYTINVTNSGATVNVVPTAGGDITSTQTEQLLRSITYLNNASDPIIGDRTFDFVLNDGQSDSNVATSIITIPVNTPPNIDLDDDDSSTATGNDYQATFSTNPVVISGGDVTITDNTNSNMQSATITLTNRPDGNIESLAVNGTLPTGITTTGYDPATGIITLTGDASIADYQTAIRQIEYDNTALVDGAQRIVTVIVNDGEFDSAIATTTITPDVPPVVNTDYQTVFTEDRDPVSIASPDAAITDGNNTNLQSATITLTNRPDGNDFESLIVNGTLPTGITASAYDPATGIITLNWNCISSGLSNRYQTD